MGWSDLRDQTHKHVQLGFCVTTMACSTEDAQSRGACMGCQAPDVSWSKRVLREGQ